MNIEADYVVIGSGAMGMAFTDEILTHSDATVALIDAHGAPGGHWNDAYPYVRLHQPSFFYGVGSTDLGSNRIDAVGWNAGLSELACGHEVCAYFDQVMQRRFLPSGRVQYYPATTYADGTATNTHSGQQHRVTARRARVDATYMNVAVPSVQPPRYRVDADVRLIPPNALPTSARPLDGYTVIGAGKTAMDAVLWLLARQVDPDAITWITPRDSWLLYRETTQPGDGFRMRDHMRFVAEQGSATAVFEALEAAEYLARIEPSVTPTMYRCATVSAMELEQLRRVTQIVRMGRVQQVSRSGLTLDDGVLPRGADTLFIDCTADGLTARPAVPVFAEGALTLQTVRACQQVFSAALIARVETLPDLTLKEKEPAHGRHSASGYAPGLLHQRPEAHQQHDAMESERNAHAVADREPPGSQHRKHRPRRSSDDHERGYQSDHLYSRRLT
ncbi:MAG: NAD(P)/FAD-dependent oxidoreductase [Pseudomonadota bacterium]